MKPWVALSLLTLVSGFSLWLGFLAIPSEQATLWVAHCGYWFVSASLLAFALSLWRVFRASEHGTLPKPDFPVLTLLLACSAFLILAEPRGYKVLMDEVLLLATSSGLHTSRIAAGPNEALESQGVILVTKALIDKRPLLFPYLVSLLHTLSGYRPSNAFLLNNLLGILFLWLGSSLGRLCAGRTGAVLGILLFAGLPLFAQNMNGGGFDLLNLVLLLATLFLALHHLQKQDAASQSALAFCACLLIQSRYESVVVALPLLLAIPMIWYRNRRIQLDWTLLLPPLLLLLSAWHLSVFAVRPDPFELNSGKAAHGAFSLLYWPENLGHLAGFFLASPWEQLNSPVFSLLGWLSLPAALFIGLRLVRKPSLADPVSVALLLGLVACLAHLALLLTYYYGTFDAHICRRFLLPFHLGLFLAFLLVLKQTFAQRPLLRRGLVATSTLCLLSLSFPIVWSGVGMSTYLIGKEVEWRLDFIARHKGSRYMVIDNLSALWNTHGATAQMFETANSDPRLLHRLLDPREGRPIYVYQRLASRPGEAQLQPRAEEVLPPLFKLEPVEERRFRDSELCRISRIVITDTP